ncbi:MAG: RimK family alpha-L-glutamate ligase [Candidatus Gracilibacteria bacterium]|jgi:ribosomal protein S6--L-glutamate ligase
MKIGILSYRSLDKMASEEEIRMKREAKARGHVSRIFRAAKFQMVYDQASPWFFYNGKPMKKYDVIITRPSVIRDVDLSIALIEQMEMAGIPLFNSYQSILKAKNKIKTVQILDHYGIPIPKTVVLHRSADVAQATKLVGGFPVIVKSPFGSFGNGVTIMESMRALNSFLVWDKPLYLLQEYVKYAKGKDMRIFVVNGKVIGGMMRSAKKGEFRSNIELGGVGAPVELTPEEISIAVRSVQALDLNYGGVDVMRSKNGPVVLEVNSNPGFKALEVSTGVNVAGAIVDYAIEFAERHHSYIPKDDVQEAT